MYLKKIYLEYFTAKRSVNSITFSVSSPQSSFYETSFYHLYYNITLLSHSPTTGIKVKSYSCRSRPARRPDTIFRLCVQKKNIAHLFKLLFRPNTIYVFRLFFYRIHTIFYYKAHTHTRRLRTSRWGLGHDNVKIIFSPELQWNRVNDVKFIIVINVLCSGTTQRPTRATCNSCASWRIDFSVIYSFSFYIRLKRDSFFRFTRYAF